MKKLQRAGWKIAVRFEPVIEAGVEAEYERLFSQTFNSLSRQAALGKSWRVSSAGPVSQRAVRLYPDEDLLARDTVQHDGMLSLAAGGEALLEALEDRLFGYVDRSRYYRCA